jgi:DNA polymerase-1
VRRFGVEAERLLDLLALTGDASNSIPGVPGVGPKTAAKLLAAWGSLEAVLGLAHEPAASDGPSRLTPTLARNLIAHADDARLARTLLALRTDLELGLNLRDLRRAP